MKRSQIKLDEEKTNKIHARRVVVVASALAFVGSRISLLLMNFDKRGAEIIPSSVVVVRSWSRDCRLTGWKKLVSQSFFFSTFVQYRRQQGDRGLRCGETGGS